MLRLDLYHLDSAYVARRAGIDGRATFDLHTRSHPFGGGYLVCAGLEPALRFLSEVGFDDDDIAYLRTIRSYDEAFLRSLRDTRFTGDVAAMPEGTIAFAGEPLLRVDAPYREALLAESGLLSAVNLSTLVATKASRVVAAAGGRPVAEFGLRRAHDAPTATRAAHIGGCETTSFVAAARAYGIRPTGTIPHALVQAFGSERDAFAAVAEALDAYAIVLDTYDVAAAVHTAVEVALDAKKRFGHRLAAVRLDSGDIAAQARLVRRVLDDAGLTDTRVVASGDLDEHGVAALVASGAPIDGFGVGTAISTGAATPDGSGGALQVAYKLAVLEAGGAVRQAVKTAPGKESWPGRKQVWRVGAFERDVIALDDEPPPAGGARPLLEPAMRAGEILHAAEPLDDLRARTLNGLAALDEGFRRLARPDSYRVERSEALTRLRRATRAAG